MIIESKLERKNYTAWLKSRMESFTDFGMDRFTGLVLGPFFYITHHAGHEFNRRITNEKTRAMGYVKATEDGCEVRFLRFMGYLDPFSIGFMYALYLVFFMFSNQGVMRPVFHLLALIAALVVGVITAVQHSLTERGEESEIELLHLLRDPTYGTE